MHDVNRRQFVKAALSAGAVSMLPAANLLGDALPAARRRFADRKSVV